MALVLIGKGLVLEGSTTKTEDIHRFQVMIHTNRQRHLLKDKRYYTLEDQHFEPSHGGLVQMIFWFQPFIFGGVFV